MWLKLLLVVQVFPWAEKHFIYYRDVIFLDVLNADSTVLDSIFQFYFFFFFFAHLVSFFWTTVLLG